MAFRIEPTLAEGALTSRRFQLLTRLDTDIATIGTWDRFLSRRTRILVPVDVQAYVVPVGGTEVTVDISGNPAVDPEPFAAGTVRDPGVHLHWALPDRLLAAARADRASRTPELPRLPDQWVVVRTLQPVGASQVLATGWVIDARTGSVQDLPSFTGPGAVPEGTLPLTGFSKGPHWTASYTSSENHFGFHDDLDDLEALKALAPQGFSGDQAVYTVAGWWSDVSQDPLAGARGPHALTAACERLGWDIDHELADDQVAPVDPRITAVQERGGLDRPQEFAKAQLRGVDGRLQLGLAGTDLSAGTPFAGSKINHGIALPRYHSLLHGSVKGVPVGAGLPAADDRPLPEELSVAAGSDVDDVIAALGAAGVSADPARRRAAEDLLAAFTHGLVSELGAPDGLDHLADREHESTFWSLPGAPVPGMRPDVLQDRAGQGSDPLTVGRHGRAGMSRTRKPRIDVPRLVWTQKADLARLAKGTKVTDNILVADAIADAAADEVAAPSTREVVKAPPRYFRPAPFLLALRGARPSHRHHGDGLFDSRGRLVCRYPAAAVPGYQGLVEGAKVLPTLGSGAIPEEVLTVVREAILLNPYGLSWLVDVAVAGIEERTAVANRLKAEMVRLYGADGRYDGTSHVAFPEPKAPSSWAAVSAKHQAVELQVSAVLAQASTVVGLPPSPVAVTTWRQPWVPLWLEWEVTVTGTTTTRGWTLVGHDLEPDPDSATGDLPVVRRTVSGRSLVGKGVGETLRTGVRSWLEAEAQRANTLGRTSYGAGAAVQRLADLDVPLDLLSASLDGLREQLLGIEFVGVVARTDGKPVASAPPVPLVGGTVRIDRLRVVDAFGRTVELPEAALDALRTTLELEVGPRTLRLRPRVQNAARWLWRLVDPGQPGDTAPELLREAFVNQVAPATAVNPVAGFLLPDHIDESLEAFTVAGDPLGQVLHDPVTGAVDWECAPGRPLPPDAAPLDGIAAQERLVGEIAAGMVRADAAARAMPEPPEDTALTAFLRAVDSTLWSVDTFASLGDGTLAGLVGRPMAVVRTVLTLDAPDDVAEVTLADGQTPEGRAAAYRTLADERFEVQLGTLGRSDDALLGFFVDDDYERLFLVDKVVAQLARTRPTGHHRGHLGVLGTDAADAEPVDLEHPYLSEANRLFLRPGQTARLTLLMIPGGRVHLTSGVLPRKQLALADAWFGPGLKKLMPSVRVGPLLVDPGEIRLPLVSLLGDRQTFTRRTGELTWKDDPIVAATQTAYLPRSPHEVQEGWIRVTPEDGGTA